MILIIVGAIVGLILIIIGWFLYCLQSLDCAPSQVEIDLLRKEAANAKSEDQPLKWMYVADAEAEFRESYIPKRSGKILLIIGIIILMISLVSFLNR